MLRTKLAKKVLTKAEQKHLTENKIDTQAKMVGQIAFMQKIQDQNPDDRYFRMMNQCYECYTIGRKLGLVGGA